MERKLLSNLIGKTVEVTSVRRTGEVVLIAPGRDGAPLFYVRVYGGELEVASYNCIKVKGD